MKNIKFWTILGVLSLGITCSIAYSSTSKASSGLQSKGKLVYQDPVSQQEVIMDANDHTILKGSIDANSGQILSLKEFQAQQEALNEDLQDKDTELESNLNDLNDNMGGLKFAQDEKGNWGYVPSGADTVIPFNSSKTPLEILWKNESTSGSATYTVDEEGIYVSFINTSGNNLVSTITCDGEELINQYHEADAHNTRQSVLNVSRCKKGDTITITHSSSDYRGCISFIAKFKDTGITNVVLKQSSLKSDIALSKQSLDISKNSQILAICTTGMNISASANTSIDSGYLTDFIIGYKMHTSFIHLSPIDDTSLTVTCNGDTSWGNVSIYILEAEFN